MKLHHVGIVTRDIEKAIKHHSQFMDGLSSNPVDDKIQGARVGFIENIEFVQPLDEGKFTSALAKKGGGLHHLCFEVEDIEKAFILNALERHEWNVTKAAEEVGMLRPNFQALMRKYNLRAKGA